MAFFLGLSGSSIRDEEDLNCYLNSPSSKPNRQVVVGSEARREVRKSKIDVRRFTFYVTSSILEHRASNIDAILSTDKRKTEKLI